MTLEKLDKAIAECKRFWTTAVEARQRLKTAVGVTVCGSRETGAARRASMDLTRALADLRKS